MPVKRRQGKMRRGEVSELAWLFMRDEQPATYEEAKEHPDAWCHYCAPDEATMGRCGRPSLESIWASHGPDVLEEWIASSPGTRPWCWWRWSAPRWPERPVLCEPRCMVGGSGEPSFETGYAYRWDLRHLLHLGIPTRWNVFDGASPPRYESQATYLRRHRLFAAGEEARLSAADFVPVMARLESA